MKRWVITNETYRENIRLLQTKHWVITEETMGYYERSYYRRSDGLLLTKHLVVSTKRWVITNKALSYYRRNVWLLLINLSYQRISPTK
jgi:hypothetical protein